MVLFCPKCLKEIQLRNYNDSDRMVCYYLCIHLYKHNQEIKKPMDTKIELVNNEQEWRMIIPPTQIKFNSDLTEKEKEWIAHEIIQHLNLNRDIIRLE